jgi:hypothetical protein
LQATGLIYEVVMVPNRDAISATIPDGGKYSAVPDGAEPFYKLDARSRHGYKPDAEEGIGGATARTAGELGYPVTVRRRYKHFLPTRVTHSRYVAACRAGDSALQLREDQHLLPNPPLQGPYCPRFRPACLRHGHCPPARRCLLEPPVVTIPGRRIRCRRRRAAAQARC